ncbi:MAG: ParB/RepB/Spo0J family partition protein [Mycoplasma sp.]
MATATKLGKGLDKLFGQNIEETIETIQRENKHEKLLMSIEKIERNPYQPRKFFDEEKIDELANSIREHGIFTPILLRKTLNDIYYIVAGERRFRAAKKVGLKEVPAIVLDIDDKKMMEISLIENIQRQDLNIIEEAKAYKSMMEKLILTQEELAKTVGKHRVHIANTLRILNLHLEIQNMVEMGDLTMGHVKPIMAISDEELAIKIARNAKEKKQTVREVEQIVQGYKLLESKKNSSKQELDHDYDFLSSSISKKISFKTKITDKQLIINFRNKDNLNKLLKKLNLLEEFYGN